MSNGGKGVRRVFREPGANIYRFTLLEFIRIDRQGQIWSVRCECGKICEYPLSAMLKGNTKSCGCLGEEHLARRRAAGATQLEKLWADDKFRKKVIDARRKVFAGERTPNWASVLSEDDPRRTVWLSTKKTERKLVLLRQKCFLLQRQRSSCEAGRS